MIGDIFNQVKAGAYNKYLAGLAVTAIGYLNQKFGWHINLSGDEATYIISFIVANVMMLVPNKVA